MTERCSCFVYLNDGSGGAARSRAESIVELAEGLETCSGASEGSAREDLSGSAWSGEVRTGQSPDAGHLAC